MGAKEFLRGIVASASEKSPEILMGLSFVSFIVAAVSMEKAVRKKDELITQAEDEKGDELTLKEKVMASWKAYIVPGVSIITGIACGCESMKQQRDRQAALAATCALSQGIIKKYEEKLEDKLGKEKADEVSKEVKEEVAKSPEVQAAVENTPRNPHCQGMHPWKDTLSNACTYATPQMLVNAEANLNRRLYTGLESYITISDMYDELNEQGVYPKLKHTSLSPMMGWTADTGGIQFDLDSDNLPMEQGRFDDGTPCYLITFKRHHEPVYIR